MYLHVWLALGTVRFCFVNAAGQCIFFYTLLYMNNGEAVEILGLSIVKSVIEARVVVSTVVKATLSSSKGARFDKGKKNRGINEKALH